MDVKMARFHPPGQVPVFKEFVFPHFMHAHSTPRHLMGFQPSNHVLACSNVFEHVNPSGPSRQDGPSQPPQVQHSYSYETSQASSTASNGGATAAGGSQLEDSKHLGPANLVGLEKQFISRTQQEVKTQQVPQCHLPCRPPVQVDCDNTCTLLRTV